MNRFVRGSIGVLVLLLAGVGSPVSGEPEAPRYGGVYIKNNIYSEPRSMDPIYALGASTIMVQMNIFDGLVRVDADRNSVVPDIAERWTHSPDGKTFTFYLRKGVRYHDGTEVTASDFKHQFERTVNPDNLSPHMARLTGVVGLKAFQEKLAKEISGIAALDKYTLRLSMEKPNILLPYYLTGTWASAVPQQVVERLGKDFGTRPVGSGPFVFESWARGRELVLRRNPSYWRKDKRGNRLPYLDKIVFRLIQDMPAVEAEIQTGTLDSAYIRASAYLKYKNHPLFKRHLVEGVEFYTLHIGFSLDAPGVPWRDKRVRQAINYAIDRKAIVDVVLHGMAYTATGALPFPALADDQTLKGYEYDPDRAKRLLVEAGFPNGFSAKITTTDSPNYVSVVEAVMGYLKVVGIRLQPEILESATARARIQEGKFEWYYSGLGGEGHPLIYMQRAFHSRYAGPGGNHTRYRNPRIDELLDRAAETRDANTMMRMVREAERIIVDDAPWWFFGYLKGVVVQQPYVRGLRAVPIDMDWQPLEEVWLAWPPKRR